MGTTEIVIIVIGVVCVIVSFFLSEDPTIDKKAEEKLLVDLQTKLSEKLLEEDNLENLLSSVKKEFEEGVEDSLTDRREEAKDLINTLSNDKIMEYEEYTGQIMEKINQNHNEVVFLYDMLKEKESSLKDFSAKLEGERKKLQQLVSEAERIKAFENRKNAEEKALDDALASVRSIDPDRRDRKTKAASSDEQKPAAKSVKTSGEKKIPQTIKATPAVNDISFGSDGGNRNEQILALYNSGRSLVEISKELGMGQGEVKLVIDLFRTTK